MGRELISFCKTCDYIIVNGRVGSDAGLGNMTCKNASVVDYVVVSRNLLYCIDEFEVMEFNDLLSDVHCPVAIFFQMNVSEILVNDLVLRDNQLNQSDSAQQAGLHVRWDGNQSETFVAGLNIETLQELERDLDAFLVNGYNVEKEDLNNLVNKLNTVFLESAKTVGMAKRKKMCTL
jgi:hypothetical protein